MYVRINWEVIWHILRTYDVGHWFPNSERLEGGTQKGGSRGEQSISEDDLKAYCAHQRDIREISESLIA